MSDECKPLWVTGSHGGLRISDQFHYLCDAARETDPLGQKTLVACATVHYGPVICGAICLQLMKCRLISPSSRGSSAKRVCAIALVSTQRALVRARERERILVCHIAIRIKDLEVLWPWKFSVASSIFCSNRSLAPSTRVHCTSLGCARCDCLV